MDRRTSKTKQAIYDAFTKLLNKHSYEKITVKDIIDEANVGRSTFYSHFETKDELARSICNMLFMHIFGHVIPPCSTHNFSELPQNAENRIAHILYHLRDKRQYYLGIIEYEEGQLFLRFMREYMLINIRVMIAGPNRSKLLEVPEEFLINHITSSFIGMVRWWMKQDMKIAPEKVAHFYMLLTNPAIAEFDSRRYI